MDELNVLCSQNDEIKDLAEFKSFFSHLSNNNEKINIIHLNIRSLRMNFNNFLLHIHDIINELNIIILTEIWINDYEINQYQIDGFDLIAQTRIYNKSGGIILYIKKNILFKNISESIKFQTAESISIFLPKINLKIISIYRSHLFQANLFNNELEINLKKLNNKNTIIIGDMNIDINKNFIENNNYIDILLNNGYTSYINTPTSKSGNKIACIDHIFIKNNCLNNINSATFDLNITDHYLLCLNFLFINPNHKIKSNDEKLTLSYNWLNYNDIIKNFT